VSHIQLEREALALDFDLKPIRKAAMDLIESLAKTFDDPPHLRIDTAGRQSRQCLIS
jgi:hypothetical protein